MRDWRVIDSSNPWHTCRLHSCFVLRYCFGSEHRDVEVSLGEGREGRATLAVTHFGQLRLAERQALLLQLCVSLPPRSCPALSPFPPPSNDPAALPHSPTTNPPFPFHSPPPRHVLVGGCARLESILVLLSLGPLGCELPPGLPEAIKHAPLHRNRKLSISRNDSVEGSGAEGEGRGAEI